MSKPDERDITKSDMIEYLDTTSDFAFELRILNKLVSLGFQCAHGGSYEDPNTKRTRQFDIRASKSVGTVHIRLAVECKNLRDNFPLLVSCIPRVEDESFHEVIVPIDRSASPDPWAFRFLENAEVVRLSGADSIYRVGEPVGKSCAQVGRHTNGRIVANDAEVFERWAQAIASANDLAGAARNAEMQGDDDGLHVFAVVPVLVVSADNLWRVSFDANGRRTEDPERTDRCSLYVDKSYYQMMGGTFVASHLEIVTPDGLAEMIGDLFTEDRVQNVAPFDAIIKGLSE